MPSQVPDKRALRQRLEAQRLISLLLVRIRGQLRSLFHGIKPELRSRVRLFPVFVEMISTSAHASPHRLHILHEFCPVLRSDLLSGACCDILERHLTNMELCPKRGRGVHARKIRLTKWRSLGVKCLACKTFKNDCAGQDTFQAPITDRIDGPAAFPTFQSVLSRVKARLACPDDLVPTYCMRYRG